VPAATVAKLKRIAEVAEHRVQGGSGDSLVGLDGPRSALPQTTDRTAEI
jgi:hypothetical protein